MGKIVFYPDPVLRKKTERVGRVDEELKAQVDELRQELQKSTNGAGLAAPQIGISRRFFGLKETKNKEVRVMINPEIIGVYGKRDWVKIKVENPKPGEANEEDFLEGCLSFPNLYGTVKRYLKVRARWQELKGEGLIKKEGEWEGFEAIVFQHELDHLNGILFVDHIRQQKGKLLRQEGEKMVEIDLNEENLNNFDRLIIQNITV